MTVGLVVVSHSARVAEGVVELCAQMAPEVTVIAAGGTDEGGIGTSFDKTLAALAAADSGDGVVLLSDLGSAEMTAQMARDFLEDPARVRLADAPVVEGALAAATTASGGADVDAVAAAAREAGGGDRVQAPGEPAPAEAAPAAQSTVTVTSALGLHARPVSRIVRAVADLDAHVSVTNVGTGAQATADSMLGLLSLEAQHGTQLRLSARGPDAAEALSRLERLAGEGFGDR